MVWRSQIKLSCLQMSQPHDRTILLDRPFSIVLTDLSTATWCRCAAAFAALCILIRTVDSESTTAAMGLILEDSQITVGVCMYEEGPHPKGTTQRLLCQSARTTHAVRRDRRIRLQPTGSHKQKCVKDAKDTRDSNTVPRPIHPIVV